MAFESQARSYINIKLRNQLSDQKYKLAIPFAEHNFGPFGRIFIAIFLFESSVTLCGVFIFSSLYPQICIF
jgi:hypothetical protein